MKILLKEFFYISNILSLVRIILILPISYLIVNTTSTNNFILVVLGILAILSDYFDGYLSRRLKIVTDLGKILDPLADKLAMAIILILLSIYRGFPFTLVALLIFRDILIITFGFILLRKSGIPIQANFWGKLNTIVIAITVLLYILNFSSVILTILIACCYLTILISGYSYYKVVESYSSLTSRINKIVIRSSLIILTCLFVLLVHGFEMQQFSTTSSFTDHTLIGISEVKEYEILKKYAPIFYLTSNEPYLPIEVDAFLDRARLMKRSFFIPFDSEIAHLKNGKNLLSKYNSSEYYLKLDRAIINDIELEYHSIKENYQSVIYGSVREVIINDNPYYIVQYWLFFYASNLGSTSITWHECDWEMVMYLVGLENNNLYAGYSQHYYGEVRRIESVEFEKDHPVVYISFGGHAMHFNEGSHKSYMDKNKLLQLGSDFCEKGIRWDPSNYEIVSIGSLEPWFEFKGYWGIPITTKLPGPKYRNPKLENLTMWKYPIEWIIHYAQPNITIP